MTIPDTAAVKAKPATPLAPPRPMKTVTNTTDPSLHPSWAAKKQNQGIQKFEGKKVVFDD